MIVAEPVDENAEEWQQVKKARPASSKSKVALSPSSRFNKTCSEAEIDKSSKGVVCAIYQLGSPCFSGMNF